MLKNIVKSILRKILNPLFLKLEIKEKNKLQSSLSLFFDEKNHSVDLFFKNLNKIGFIPKHIVDIGANHGNWTRVALNYFPDSFFTLIEPQSQLKKSIEDILNVNSRITFNVCGAGSKSGSFLFTIVDRDDSCSFRYTKEEAEKLGFNQIEIPVITLNDIVKNNPHLPFPDLVKIDAEGLDLDVLEGASELIGKTEIFLVEAAVFCKKFKNNLLTVVQYMDQKGYTIFDITDLNRPFNPEVLWLTELVFIKKGGVIDSFNL